MAKFSLMVTAGDIAIVVVILSITFSLWGGAILLKVFKDRKWKQ
jgi:hypothetical protein